MNRPLASILLLVAVASPVFAGRYKITGREEVSDGDGHRLILSVESKEPVTTDEAQAAAERIVDDLFRDRGLRAVELRFRTRDGAPDAAPEAVLRWAPADYPDSVTPQRPSDFAAYGLTVREGALLAPQASPDTVAAPTTPPPTRDWGAAPAREHTEVASETAEKTGAQAARVETSMAHGESIASRVEVAAAKAETAANRVASALARLEALERERPAKAETAANRGATEGKHPANDLVLRFLREWKAEWESRNLAGYMAFYADDFRSGDMDRWAWAAQCGGDSKT